MRKFIPRLLKQQFQKYALSGLMALSSLGAMAQVSKEIGSVNSFQQLLSSNASKSTARQAAVNVTLQGPTQDFQAKINASYNNAGYETYAGKILNHGWADFHVQFKNGKASGLIVLFDEKKAFEFTTNASGNVVIKAKDFDKTISVDDFGKSTSVAAPATTLATTPGTTANGAVIPLLQSNTSASTVVYLDFDGEYVVNTPWNGGVAIDAAPASGSAQDITVIWQMVVEDYAPFNLNVTTNRAVYDATPAGRRQMVIFTPTTTAAPGAGGVAYITGFSWLPDLPCWVFNSPTDPVNSAEAASHEVGHTFGLGHDGRNFPDGTHEEYYYGHANWAPIVGVAYGKTVSQFSKGEYLYASNTQDDLEVIASSTNGFGYKSDDHGTTAATATVVNLTNNSATIPGFIGTPTDKDYFKFNISAATANININKKYGINTNLNVLAQILNSSLQVVAESNPTDVVTASFANVSLAAGVYYLVIDGVGEGDASTGYTDYGSLGEYVVSATFSPSSNACTDPTWNAATAYSGGAKVSYNNLVYTANWWTQNNQPDVNAGPVGTGKPWTQTGTCAAANKTPVVTFTAPAKNAIINLGSNVNLVADAVDPDGTISKVEFLNASDAVVGTDLTYPYELLLTGLNVGSYVYKVRAYDNNNFVSDLAYNNFEIKDLSPQIVISSPLPNEVLTLSAGQKINVTVLTNPAVVDSVKYIIVDVVCNGPGCANVRRFTQTVAPYHVSYDPIVGAVSSQVNAIAFKNGIGSTVTAVINYTVINAVAPVIAITSSLQGQTFYEYPSDGRKIEVTLSQPTPVQVAIDSVKYFVIDMACNGPGCATVRKFTVKTAPFNLNVDPIYTAYATAYQAINTEIDAIAFSNGIASEQKTIYVKVKPLPELTIVTPANNISVNRTTTSFVVDVNVNTTQIAIDSVVYTVYDTKTTGMSGVTTTRKFVMAAPYDLTLPIISGNTFTRIFALAYGDGGKFSRSQQVQVNYNDAPTVVITDPTSTFKFNIGGSVTIKANVTDSDGSIAKVEIYSPHIANSKITLTAAPYEATFANMESSGMRGATSFVVIATDNNGGTNGASIDVYENKAPIITLTSPLASNGINPTYVVGGSMTVSANVMDYDGTITKVEILNGITTTGMVTLTAAPYTTTFTNLPAPFADGSYSFKVKAYDNNGGVSEQLIVVYKNRVPAVTITTPVNNPTFAVGSTVTIGALPYDPDWTSGKLEFFNGATKLGEQVIASTLAGTAYNFNMSNVALGTYNITVKATDNMGESGTSSIATFTVTGNTCTVQAWNIATAYNGTTRVSKNGTIYEAKWWTQGNDPLTNSGTWDVWKVIGACNARLGEEATIVENNAYPNPFTNTLTVTATVNAVTAQVSILNLNGEIVLTNAETSNVGVINTTFDTSNLVSGIYVVQLIAGNEVITYKVSK